MHLTFARRAYELADWYRARGAKVIFGGLHVLSCPEECAPHADALAVGEACRLWAASYATSRKGTLKPVTRGVTASPIATTRRRGDVIFAAPAVSDHHQPDRHARLSQSLRLLLPRHRRLAHAVSGPRCGADRGRVRRRWPAVRGVHRQQPGIEAATICGALLRWPARKDLERRRLHRRDRRSHPDPRDGAGRLHRRLRRLRVAAPTRTSPTRTRRRRRPATTRAACASCTTTASR